MEIEMLKIGDTLFASDAGEASMADHVNPRDNFEISVISSAPLYCENPHKNIRDTIEIQGGKIPDPEAIQKYCVIIAIEKHSKFRWTIFGAYVYSASRIMVNAYDVQFD